MADPFEVVHEEARQQILEISAQLQRWQELRRSSGAADAAEASKIKTSIGRSLAELNLDLSDLQSTVSIAARDPTKYHLTQADIDHRRKFVAEMQSDAAAVQAELDVDSSPTPGKKKSERQGLLAGSTSSSSDPVEPAGMAGGGSGGKGWAMRKENSNMLQQQQQQQVEQMELQDIELGGLGETVDRLGAMGRVRARPGRARERGQRARGAPSTRLSPPSDRVAAMTPAAPARPCDGGR
jgi:hypothetical protein